MIKRYLKRWADAAIAKDNDRLQTRCDVLDSRLKLQQLELDELAAVVARNLKRVESETAIYTRRIADSEASQNVAAY